VTYQDSKGNVIKTIEGNEGDDLLSLAHEHDIDLEGEFWSQLQSLSLLLLSSYCRSSVTAENRAPAEETTG
jgi:hypothetical protein